MPHSLQFALLDHDLGLVGNILEKNGHPLFMKLMQGNMIKYLRLNNFIRSHFERILGIEDQAAMFMDLFIGEGTVVGHKNDEVIVA